MKGTEEFLFRVDSSVPLIVHDLSDLTCRLTYLVKNTKSVLRFKNPVLDFSKEIHQ